MVNLCSELVCSSSFARSLGGNSLQPLVPIRSIIASPCPVHAQKAREAVNSHLPMQDIQSMPLESFIGHLFEGIIAVRGLWLRDSRRIGDGYHSIFFNCSWTTALVSGRNLPSRMTSV